MIDERFSKQAFELCGLDTCAAGKLAKELADEVQKQMHKVIEPSFTRIVETLNRMGHNLCPYEAPVPGDLTYRDDLDGEAMGYSCRLRLAFTSVVSCGYAHLATAGDDLEDEHVSEE